MSIAEEEISTVIDKVKQGDFRGAAQIIIANPEVDEEHLDLISEMLKNISSITANKVQDLHEIYQKDHANLAKLKNSIANMQDLVSSNEEVYSLEDVSKLSNEQLSGEIEKLRKDQSKKGAKQNIQFAQKINFLANEQKKRDPKHISEAKKNASEAIKNEDGADNWFVLPDSTTLESIEDVIVILGSPATDVLRERYMKQYKMSALPQFTKEQLSAMNAEDNQDAERELSRQTEFVETFKDSERVLDRDIFVNQIALKFSDNKYAKVPVVRPKDEKGTKNYYLASGEVSIKYDFDKKLHSVNINGSIPGRFSIAIKRRTNSGRIIGDSYAILEVSDSEPVFYSFSSKGMEALSRLSQLKRVVARSSFNLSTKESAKIGAQEGYDKTTSNALNPEGIEDSNIKSKDESKQPAGIKSPLRDQLTSYITTGASKTSINFLAQQIAKEEGKEINIIKSEFNLSTETTEKKPSASTKKSKKVIAKQIAQEEVEEINLPTETKEKEPKATTKKSKKVVPDLSGTEFLKERVKDLKKSIKKSGAKSKKRTKKTT